MYQPSKQYDSFYISGLQYYDGAFALDKLKPGKKVKMVAVPDNPYDPNAVALHYKDTMLGYVPSFANGTLAFLMYFGHKDVFEARVIQVNPEADPWNQVRVGIFVKDRR